MVCAETGEPLVLHVILKMVCCVMLEAFLDPVRLPFVARPLANGVAESLRVTVQEFTSLAFQLIVEVPPPDADDTRSGFAIMETLG